MSKYGNLPKHELEDIRRALQSDGNHPKELKKVEKAAKEQGQEAVTSRHTAWVTAQLGTRPLRAP